MKLIELVISRFSDAITHPVSGLNTNTPLHREKCKKKFKIKSQERKTYNFW